MSQMHATTIAVIAIMHSQEQIRFLILTGSIILQSTYRQEQERKLLEQASLKANGDEEAMDMDYDYIGAMEYGMPPISGWGMGIDRMIQLLTNSDNIRDVVMYPLMRPQDKSENQEEI